MKFALPCIMCCTSPDGYLPDVVLVVPHHHDIEGPVLQVQNKYDCKRFSNCLSNCPTCFLHQKSWQALPSGRSASSLPSMPSTTLGILYLLNNAVTDSCISDRVGRATKLSNLLSRAHRTQCMVRWAQHLLVPALNCS